MTDEEVDVLVLKDYEYFEDRLAHIGVIRRSGRYPWGSGDNAYQRHKGFFQYVDDLKSQGFSDAEIVKALNLRSVNELKTLRTIHVTAQRQEKIARVRELKDKGLSNVAIGEKMGIGESSVRALLNPVLAERAAILNSVADNFKKYIGKDGVIDISAGVEAHLGISDAKKKAAILKLRAEGYEVFYVPNTQLGTGKDTNTKVLAAPGMTYPDVMEKARKNEIGLPFAYTDDGGRSFHDFKPPVNADSKRIQVRYAEEGGTERDGVIELRRGVSDISLGSAKYAQVRIAVDGTHYLKGMAMYADDLPDGIDMRFNTNKSSTGNKLDAMKPLKVDKATGAVDQVLPFGAIVNQRKYTDASGKERQSVINIVGDNEEGRWDQWSKTLSSQFLSKQSTTLAKEQLGLAFRSKQLELDEISALTNPVVRKKMLEDFADGADSSAVHLKAAALPRTTNRVILPISSMKDHEIYAPQYNNGEKVTLVRHPHAGRFEIPELTVNNRNMEARRILGGALDAVGINSKVAERLSGADFDGDSVLVIPNNHRKVQTAPALAGLKNFDPQKYKLPEDAPKMSSKTKGREMGVVSNLITDMQLRGATDAELARAARHSMVVIDAEKHHLDYKQSAKDNDIAGLKKKYQVKPDGSTGGASTLISRASAEINVANRKARKAADGGGVNRETGELEWTPTGESYTKVIKNKAGAVTGEKTVVNTFKSKQMMETRDARTLSSGTPMEEVYANHANRMKTLANQARLEALGIKPHPVSKSASETYAPEVTSLKEKLRRSQMNAPLERKAQFLAKTLVSQRTQGVELKPEDLKRIKNVSLEEARARVGASKERVNFTKREWEAVQSNAVSGKTLADLLRNADMDVVKTLATPRERTVMTAPKMQRAKALLTAGYTQAEIANLLGVPTSTLNSALGEG